jgi:hypothetical protein
MNDPMSLARSARENLAQGLAALQSPGVPPQVMDVAEPIARAMSALHQIESTRGGSLAESGPLALDALRRALAMLQSQPNAHPAVNQALEAIASSLSMVHTISQAAPSPAHAHAPFAGTAVMTPGAAQYGAGVPTTQPSVAMPPPQFGGYAQPQPGYSPPNAQHAGYPPAHAPGPQYAPPQQAPHPMGPAYAPTVGADPLVAGQYRQQAAPPGAYPAPAAPPAHAPPMQQQYGAPAPGGARPGPGMAPSAPQAPLHKEGAIRVEAELGAHSATNFYKGLSGNDVIDSGGIFIATYQIPDIGQDVLIKVSMPGGYEFEALGTVKWTRDMPHSGADAPPGFGAQFTQISPEGRQLVYRYVRNREPLFHDDL